MELTFYTALIIGLLGSTHCIGMCGGIVGALSTGLKNPRPVSDLVLASYLLAYNAGRILSYTAAGALAGLIGAQAAKFSADSALSVGRLVAGLFMIALGLYLADWWRAIAVLETAGLRIWRVIQPLGRRFIPARTTWQALGLGLVWGWLPCGLVYSALALAMASASPQQGALTMLGFGLGTLPMLLAMGSIIEYLRQLVRHSAIRQGAGLCVMLFGVHSSLLALEMLFDAPI